MAASKANNGKSLDVASLRIRLRKSTNRRLVRHRACVAGLGLRRIGDEVLLPDKPEIRGMVNRVRYLLDVEEVAPAKKPTGRKAASKSAAKADPKTAAKSAAKAKTVEASESEAS